MLIEDLIIIEEQRNQGIGSKLLKKVLALKEKYNLHKVILFTGVGWPANTFYLRHGFQKVAELKNHYLHKDFTLYEKLI